VELWIGPYEDWVSWYDEEGVKIGTHLEVVEARQQAESRLQETETQARAEALARKQEAQARQQAESRLQEAEERIRELEAMLQKAGQG
jgi:hypothetical protein